MQKPGIEVEYELNVDRNARIWKHPIAPSGEVSKRRRRCSVAEAKALLAGGVARMRYDVNCGETGEIGGAK